MKVILFRSFRAGKSSIINQTKALSKLCFSKKEC